MEWQPGWHPGGQDYYVMVRKWPVNKGREGERN